MKIVRAVRPLPAGAKTVPMTADRRVRARMAPLAKNVQ